MKLWVLGHGRIWPPLSNMVEPKCTEVNTDRLRGEIIHVKVGHKAAESQLFQRKWGTLVLATKRNKPSQTRLVGCESRWGEAVRKERRNLAIQLSELQSGGWRRTES